MDLELESQTACPIDSAYALGLAGAPTAVSRNLRVVARDLRVVIAVLRVNIAALTCICVEEGRCQQQFA